MNNYNNKQKNWKSFSDFSNCAFGNWKITIDKEADESNWKTYTSACTLRICRTCLIFEEIISPPRESTINTVPVVVPALIINHPFEQNDYDQVKVAITTLSLF